MKLPKKSLLSALGLTLMVTALASSALVFAQSPTDTSVKSEPVEVKDDVNESADLAQYAKISESEALSIAAANYTGSGVTPQIELEDENGTIVYGIEYKEVDGNEVDIKIDVSTGELLKSDSDDDEIEEEDEGDENDGIEHEFEGEEDHQDEA